MHNLSQAFSSSAKRIKPVQAIASPDALLPLVGAPRRGFSARCLNAPMERPKPRVLHHKTTSQRTPDSNKLSTCNVFAQQNTHARSFSSTPRTLYKTVQEAQARYKSGVSTPLKTGYAAVIIEYILEYTNDILLLVSPSHGKQGYCSSLLVPG